MKYLGVFPIATCLLWCSIASAQSALSLSQALQTAKENSPVLRSEKLNINISQSDLITAKLRPNPSLNNQSLQLVRPSVFPSDTRWNNARNRQVWWQLTKPFQLPSQRQYKIEFAQQQIKLTESNYYDIERNLTFDVASKWLDAWRVKQMLSVLQQAQLNFDSLVTIQKARLRNQVITTTELTRIEIPLERYNLQLKETAQEYKNAILELKYFLGSNDSIDIDNRSLIEVIPVTNRQDSLLEVVIENRSDVKAIQNSIAVSESNIKLQKAMRLPQPELGVIWNPQNSIPYLGFFGTIELPIFSRNQGEINKSTYLKMQAEQNLQTVQLKITSEITSAYQTYRLQKETLDRYAQILQQSQEVLHSVRYAYLKGGTTLIDLLEAERSWYDTQQLFYDAQTTYYQSYLKLLFAAGLITQL